MVPVTEQDGLPQVEEERSDATGSRAGISDSIGPDDLQLLRKFFELLAAWDEMTES